MKKFIKDNIVLAFGVSLPFFLVVLLFLAKELPQYFVDSPKYDFLFTDRQYYGDYEFEVENQKLYVKKPQNIKNENIPYNKLYRYVAATGKVREVLFKEIDNGESANLPTTSNGISANIVIAVDPNKLPSIEQAKNTSQVVSQIQEKKTVDKPSKILISELAKENIDINPISPDGYVFSKDFNHRRFGFFGGYGGEKQSIFINKKGRVVPIPRDQYGTNAGSEKFIGWVVP